MKNAVIIQQVDDPKWALMIALFYERMAQYCHRHNFDYWVQSGPARHYLGEGNPWGKVALVQQALLQGYENVVCMDADAFVLDMNADLRQACVKAVNLVWWEQPFHHLQGGVTYWHGEDAYKVATYMLTERRYYLERFPNVRGHYEQGQLNEMYEDPRNHYLFGELDIKWNWGEAFCPPCEQPAVIAWHGLTYEEKYPLMKEWLKNHESNL